MSRINELRELIPQLRFVSPVFRKTGKAGQQPLCRHPKQLKADLLALSRMISATTSKGATDARDYYQGKWRGKTYGG